MHMFARETIVEAAMRIVGSQWEFVRAHCNVQVNAQLPLNGNRPTDAALAAFVLRYIA